MRRDLTTHRVSAALAALSLAFALGTTTKPARAEDTARVAAATVLFDEGIAAMSAGRLGEACPKLAKSHGLAPSGGTLLALGECEERIGRVASAWVAFREAASRAAAAGKTEAEAGALTRAARLEPRLPRLTVRAPHAKDNVEIRRDGVLLAPAELGLPVPIDPGRHEVRASSPYARPWTKTVELKEGAPTIVDIPELTPTSSEPPPGTGDPGPTTTAGDGSTQRTIGILTGAVGLGAIGVGSVFGVVAMNTNDEAKTYCQGNACAPKGLSLTDDARSQALLSTILFITGGAALVGGAVLYLTAPAPSSQGSARPSLRLTPILGTSSAGASAVLHW